MKQSRHLNFTGRKKIDRSCFEIKINRDHTPPSFEAGFNLNKLALPSDAELCIEAYYQNSSQRFSFGTIGQPERPASSTLDQIDLSGPTLFRIKVIDKTNKVGMLLASAEEIRPLDEGDSNENSSPLMAVMCTELGQQIWKLDYQEDEKPVLCINSKIPAVKERLLKDPRFAGTILPAVMREILILVCWNNDGEPGDGTWQSKWIDFSTTCAGNDFPDGNDPVQIVEWIDDAVNGFCERHSFTDLYLGQIQGAE